MADQTENDPALEFDPTKKKKKKKNIDLREVLKDDEEPAAAPVDDDDVDFSKLKKKKKKPIDVKAVLDEPDEKLEGDDEEIDFSKKKKKAKAKFIPSDEEDEEASKKERKVKFEDEAGDKEGEYGISALDIMKQASWIGSERDYSYEELLDRVFNIMRERNPEHAGGEKKRFVMRPPQLARIGSKKSSLVNFGEICKAMRRAPRHVISFLFAELGTTGSVDGNNQLIVKGRFQQKQIENVLRRYIKEYVTCHTCRSPDTALQKDEQTRVTFLQCETCGSKCSVNKVQKGFQAVTGKRAAARAKAQAAGATASK